MTPRTSSEERVARQPLAIEYSGIEIFYRESDNRWEFELRGRQRSAESLAKAKEAIDKPLPESKAKPFERFDAYKIGYGSGDAFRVTVTSIAERGWRSETEYWVTSEKRGREKVSGSDLYIVSPENDGAIAEIDSLLKQSQLLEDKAHEIYFHRLKKIESHAREEVTA